MKNLNLTDFGVQEMNAEEMSTMNGGWFSAALAVAGAAIYVYNNWDDFKAGFKAGWQQS